MISLSASDRSPREAAASTTDSSAGAATGATTSPDQTAAATPTSSPAPGSSSGSSSSESSARGSGEHHGFSVGGAFSLGDRRSDKARRAQAAAEAGPERTYVDNSARTDLAVSVQHLSVTYRTTFERVPTFKNAIVRLGRGERALVEVQALKDVSFDVPNGTQLGIIGANGAGKSTIMRTIAGILPPTEGRVEVWGRASTLLALGVGFNAQLSGRENVILGGLASGLSRAEVEERAHDVAEWAELGDYIDAPMRTYSSGMFSRLAFSVAVHMKPDILMIDEALSAGDAKFREKANAKMDELRSSARAMFLVSHGLSSIKDMCTDCLWLHKGQLMMRGKPEECIDAYTTFVKVGKTPSTMDEM